MSDGASLNIKLNRAEQVDINKNEKSSANDIELANIGVFNSDSDNELDNNVENKYNAAYSNV